MANFKIVISDPKSRKAYQKEVDQTQSGLFGKKIGDRFNGNLIGLAGYELEITGGSDKEGFPMRRDIDGFARKKVLLSGPPGYHPKSRGMRKRVSVRGNTISPQISQINVKVVSYGQKPIEEILGVKAKEKPEEKKPEKEIDEKSEVKEEKTESEKKG